MTATDDWFDHLRQDRDRSAHTIATYRRTLRTLPVDPLTATREDLEAWWRARALDADGADRPHSSRNNELSALRSFYRWAMAYDLRDDDPTRRINQLRGQHRDSRFVGAEDMTTLLTVLKPDMRRAVALGAYAGLRVSEAASLHWADIHTELRRLTVIGKGDKQRSIGFGVHLLDLLLPNTGGNVVTGTSTAYSAHYLQMKVNTAMRDAGVTESFHKLRHRFGYKAASAGVPTTSIAKAMGHASLTTTMGYIHPMDSDLDLIADAVTR